MPRTFLAPAAPAGAPSPPLPAQLNQDAAQQGGQDAFVPAFFRAQVLSEFNKSMKPAVQAYATNRDDELINGDWAVHKVMKGSPLAGEVEQMMKTGGLDPVVKRHGNTVMGYYP